MTENREEELAQGAREYFEGLLRWYRSVLNQTIDKHPEGLTTWYAPQTIWTQLDYSLNTSYDWDDLITMMTYIRFYQFQEAPIWIGTSAYFGGYKSCIRDCRYHLEDILQAVYLDGQMGHKTWVGDKFEELNNIQLRGSKLIESCELPLAIEPHLKSLYHELCDFIHPSLRSLDMYSDPRSNVYYDGKSFELASELTSKSFDVIYYLVMQTFPEGASDFFKRMQDADGLDLIEGYALCQSLYKELME